MQQTKHIELFIDFAGAYGRGVTRGIMRFAHGSPSWVVSRGSRWHNDRPVFKLMGKQVHGLIVQSFSPQLNEIIRRHKLPVVNFSSFHPTSPFPTVVSDNAGIGRLVATHFLDKGFRRFAFFGPVNSGYGIQRLAAFRETVVNAKCSLTVCHPPSHRLKSWLKKLPRPIALFAVSDQWAIQVVNACNELNIRVPEDVAIIGVDDDELFNFMSKPTLSSVKLPLDQIGYLAAQLLDKMIRNKSARIPPITALPPLHIIERQSSNSVAIEDQDLAAALRFIRSHVHQPFTVDDILDEVPLGRRSLERRMRTTLGHSLHEEIIRTRIDEAKRLLAVTDLPVERIAINTGFSTPTYFAAAFKKATHTSPSMYRRKTQSPTL